MDNQIQVNEANETKALIHELMAAVSKEAKQLFVSRLNELVYERHGSREGKVLEIAVEDAEGIDLEWLQERLSDKASAEINRLQGFVEGLVKERPRKGGEPMQNTIQSREFKAVLARAGLTQYRLAVNLGVAPTKLSGLLHGRLAASEAESLRERIEAHLGLAPGSLVGR